MRRNLGNIMISNMIWRFAERICAQSISFVVSIILARLLSPNEFGIIALTTVFLNISNIFVDCGLGTALIQKKEPDDLDYSSVFYFNIISCTVIYLLIFMMAPYIAQYYKKSELILIIRVLGISILISAVKNIQNAYVAKKMMFKKFFFSTLIGTVISAIVGISLAIMKMGVWALVGQQLTNLIIDTGVLWYTVGWKPKKMFSISRLEKLFRFGWKLFVSALVHTVYDNIRQLLIGKYYTAEELAFYSKGKQLPQLIITNINITIDSVLFPVMAEEQNDKESVRRLARKSIRMSSFIIWPIMIGMAATSETLIKILITDKWLFCVPFIKIFCVCNAFQPIHTANLNAIKAVGRSDVFLKLEIIKKIIGFSIVFIAVRYGVTAIAISSIVYNVIAQLINTFPNKKLLGYGYWEQLRDIMPFIAFSIIMGLGITCYEVASLPDISLIAVQVISGILIYYFLCKLFRVEELIYLKNVIKEKISYLKNK